MRVVITLVAFAACRATSTAPDANPPVAASGTVDANLPVAVGGTADARLPSWIELYYPGWAMGKWPPSSIRWAAVTDVVLFGLVPDGTGIETQSSGLTRERIAAATRAARAEGVKVLVSLGGEKTGRRFRDAGVALAERVAAFVREHGLDGVVLDIEPLADVAEPVLVAFVRALHARVSRIEAVVAPEASEIARLAPIAPELHRVGIMTYLRRLDAAEEAMLLARVPKPPADVALGHLGAANAILWHIGLLCDRRDAGLPCDPTR